MDIKIVDQKGEVVKNEPKTEVKSPETTTIPHGTFLRDQVAMLFDLKPSEISQYDSKIQTLLDYAKTKTEDHSPEGIKWALRSLSLKIGTPPLGEKMINYLTKYAYLYTEKQQIEKQLKRYEDKT